LIIKIFAGITKIISKSPTKIRMFRIVKNHIRKKYVTEALSLQIYSKILESRLMGRQQKLRLAPPLKRRLNLNIIIVARNLQLVSLNLQKKQL